MSVKNLVKPHPNPLPFDKLRASLGKEREQEFCFSSGISAKLPLSSQDGRDAHPTRNIGIFYYLEVP